MFAMREHQVLSCWQPHVGKFSRESGDVAHFDACEIVEPGSRPVVPTDAVRNRPNLAGNLANMGGKALPLRGNVDSSLKVVAHIQAGDYHIPPMLESGRSKA